MKHNLISKRKSYLILITAIFFLTLALYTTSCSKKEPPVPPPKQSKEEPDEPMGKIKGLIIKGLTAIFGEKGFKLVLDKDTIEKLNIIINNLKEKKQLDNISASMLTKKCFDKKKGYLMNFTEDKRIAVVLYYNFKNFDDANKIFSLVTNPKTILSGPIFYFDFNVSNKLSKNQMENLDKLNKLLTENKENIEAIITMGHTCDIGEDEYNLALSIKRAQFLTDKFCQMKINMIAIGFGEYFPAMPNINDENRAQNRRVEIIIVPKVDQK
ncbi:MAG: OmpA family protein [Candidatus Goldbacteria bacterium]|nr:OmpA family protein [Candidatus Goldiibacteriota bacterium]